MFDDVLVPVDGTDGADTAIEYAAGFADHFDATIRVLYVADTNRDSVTVVGTDVVDALEREGEDIVERVAADVRERGVDCETDVVQGAPAPTIADYAEAQEMDLVVMPTSGRTGLSRYLLGSVTEKVVRHSVVPVLSVRMHEDARTPLPYENILLPTDGSAEATAASDRAVELAGAFDATLHVLSVVDDAALGLDVRSAPVSQQFEETATEAVEDAATRATDAGVEDVVETVQHGTTHQEILAYVDDNDVDVVVMGTAGRGGVDRVLLGSVTERIVRTSPVPVLTVRQ